MDTNRIEGAATGFNGRVQGAAGKLTGDSKLQVEGKINEIKGQALEAYGRVVDSLDRNVHRVPARYQARARQGVDFARNKPLLTTGIVAGAAILLSGLLGRRR